MAQDLVVYIFKENRKCMSKVIDWTLSDKLACPWVERQSQKLPCGRYKTMAIYTKCTAVKYKDIV